MVESPLFWLIVVGTLTIAQSASVTQNCRAISPPPQGLICGLTGVYLEYEDPAPIPSAIVSGFRECRDLALDALVPSFSLDRSNNNCTFYDIPAPNYANASSDPSSHIALWDSHCFNCTQNCPGSPDAASGNIVRNGGFERFNNSIAPWAEYDDPYGNPIGKYSIVTPGYRSARAGSCVYGDNTVIPPNKCDFSQSFALCNGISYRASFDFKYVVHDVAAYEACANQQPDNYYPFRVSGFQFRPNATGSLPANRWTHFDYQLASQEGIYIAVACMDEILIDNLVVTPILGRLPYASGSQNLFGNPGFETNQLAPWTLTPYLNEQIIPIGNHTFNHSSAIRGKTSLDFYSYPGYTTEYNFIFSAPQAPLQQVVKTIPGRSYILEFDYNITWTSTVQSPILYTAINRDLPNDNNEIVVTYITDSHQNRTITHYQHLFYAAATKTVVQIAFQYWDNLLIDNLSWREAGPRPSK